MDVMRGFMNWPLQVKIEKTEGLASRAFPPLSLLLQNCRFSLCLVSWADCIKPKGLNLESQP